MILILYEVNVSILINYTCELIRLNLLRFRLFYQTVSSLRVTHKILNSDFYSSTVHSKDFKQN
jgi:hypothetical protein